MGCSGPLYTWHREGCESRIDRVLVNSKYMETYRDACVKHLPWFKSDHRPILLLSTIKAQQGRCEQPFRVVASWVLHEDFARMVKDSWDVTALWEDNVGKFTKDVGDWCFKVFGHLGRQKRKIMGRLEGITKSNSNLGLSSDLSWLQSQLWMELEQILIQEDLLWAQKAKCKWYAMGDKNTKYYHARANSRRKRNKIEAIMKETGEWTDNAEEIKSLATDFFIKLFSEESNDYRAMSCSFSYPIVEQGAMMGLNSMITNEEIKAAIFSMGALKSPGPDGLNALFFQSQWETLAPSVINLVKKAFEEPRTVRDINQTFIVLIPKREYPETIRDFRPISLCNVIYKIISKIISNRIKCFLPQVISPNQCSFVPGRTSSDNIIVAQEVIHSMRNMKGKKGFMAIKIDLEKAYDRLRWDFIMSCLVELQLPQYLLDVIRMCISSTTMQILWEGRKANMFSPSRGLRQGDPISPYLFVICMEKLAHIIQEAVIANHWKPIRLGKDGPPITHLFFADDLLLFAEASLDQVDTVKGCLDRFCSASGQKVNPSKTRVFFSNNVNHARVTQMRDALGFQSTVDLGKYLGVPLHHERVTTGTYHFLIDKVKNRLNSWQISRNSFAGRDTLIKSVIAAMPSYTMQTVNLPVPICESIEKQSRNFLWGSSEERRRMHLVAWDKICTEKKYGGLGMRHIKQQNRAFMMKLGWGLVTNRDSLWVRVLRGKYGCGNDLIPHINPKRVGSNTWSGIKKSWGKVLEGIQLARLNDGTNVARWKWEKHGSFTVRSAYKSLSPDHIDSPSPWSNLWKLKVPQRCKTFAWLMLQGRLITNKLKHGMNLHDNGICDRCQEKWKMRFTL